ncbi:sodium:solute symporter family protein, partial [Rickettsia endosymbiont of Cardiosporidium cionae]|uniref:sodium:solute symporter family protein n=1 Tax=Rickettsia endosymbiont of Cardiosporidium cionae TaxID=2777155 RepID=UPI0018958F7B
MESVVESVKIPLEFADKSIIIVFIGIICWTGLKNIFAVKTFKFFALGNRNFSTGALVATIVATYMSGSSFFLILSNVYNKGLYIVLVFFSSYIAIVVLGTIIVPRMQDFLGNISIAEAIDKIYGKWAKYVVSLTIIINSAGAVAVQFKAFGKIFEYFSTISPTTSIVFSALLVTLYSTIGGIKAVVYTDIVQFLAFSFAIILIGIIVFHYADISDKKILQIVENKRFNLNKIFDTNDLEFWDMMNLSLFFFIQSLVAPTMLHRILMGSNLARLRKVMIISAIVLVFVKIMMVIIPISLFVINPKLDPEALIPEIVNKYSPITGISGMLILAIIAMSMSTADSQINTSAVTFANDIWPSKNPKHKLFAAKFFSLIVGAMGLGIAITNISLLKIITVTAGIYLSIVIPVLLLTIFGFRTDKSVILTSMGVGFAFIMLFRVYLPETEPSV